MSLVLLRSLIRACRDVSGRSASCSGSAPIARASLGKLGAREREAEPRKGDKDSDSLDIDAVVVDRRLLPRSLPGCRSSQSGFRVPGRSSSPRTCRLASWRRLKVDEEGERRRNKKCEQKKGKQRRRRANARVERRKGRRGEWPPALCESKRLHILRETST